MAEPIRNRKADYGPLLAEIAIGQETSHRGRNSSPIFKGGVNRAGLDIGEFQSVREIQ